MTKRDFFILILKLFGLYSATTFIFTVFSYNHIYMSSGFDYTYILMILFNIIVIAGLFLLLIFKADKIATFLKLDKGFDEDRIDLSNIKSENLLKIGIFIIGGFLILDNLPIFLKFFLSTFKTEASEIERFPQNNYYFIVSGVKLILGYLLITKYDFVASLLKTKENK